MLKKLAPWLTLLGASTVTASMLVAPWTASAQQPLRESNESLANYAGAAALVEHDTNLLAPNCRAVYATSTGNLVVDMAREGTDITFPVDANRIYELRIKRFKTASTATAICLF